MMNSGSGHTSPSQLALFSRGELSLWARWIVQRHISWCEECSRLVKDFVQIQEQLSTSASELPPGISEGAWQCLASEMTANIHLAISAGECVSRKQPLAKRPRLVFAAAGLAVLLLFASFQSPHFRDRAPLAKHTGYTLEASGSGIAVEADGRLLSVPAPAGADVVQTVNTRGDMHSRYTDDTGVTINAVYADAE